MRALLVVVVVQLYRGVIFALLVLVNGNQGQIKQNLILTQESFPQALLDALGAVLLLI